MVDENRRQIPVITGYIAGNRGLGVCLVPAGIEKKAGVAHQYKTGYPTETG